MHTIRTVGQECLSISTFTPEGEISLIHDVTRYAKMAFDMMEVPITALSIRFGIDSIKG